MFAVLDTAPTTGAKPRPGADRACDQCKMRKVRCNMAKPCSVCTSKRFECTYDKARKKRGPVGKRIQEIVKAQAEGRGTDGSVGLGKQGSSPDSATPDGSSMMLSQQRQLSQQMDGLQSMSQDAAPMTPTTSRTNSSYDNEIRPQLPYWPNNPAPQRSGVQEDDLAPLQPIQTTTTAHSEVSGLGAAGVPLTGANFDDFIFPSLPVDSPSNDYEAFGSIPHQSFPDLPEPQITTDIWPASINEETLLPWIDVYFKRLHPTIPILNRTTLYREMLMRKHHQDSQYGAMLLSLCAFAMSQPIQIHERASTPSRAVQANMLMEECVKMRVAADFGEEPCIEMVLTSFFLFACLFQNAKHKAARLRLREAVDLAQTLGLHLPVSYEGLGAEKREQWLRSYLVLSVTERAYALQQRHSIDFRGRPGITARFMQAFDPEAATEYISHLIFQEQSDAVGMTGLLYLMETFDAIDESVIECWNGYCKYSDGACELFDRRRALQMFRAQHRARDACVNGNISFAPSASPLPLHELVDSQQADITLTQFWLLNRLWFLCLSHSLLRETSDHAELCYGYACQIASQLLVQCDRFALSAMEVHGVGFAEKLYDVASGVVTALKSSTSITLDSAIATSDVAYQFPANMSAQPTGSKTVRELLQDLERLLRSFRGGDHPYAEMFQVALSGVVGYDNP